MPDVIGITGLGRLDFLDFRDSLTAQDVTVDEQVQAPGVHGELATLTAVIVVSQAVIFPLAVWLWKGRKSNRVTLKGWRRRSDGTEEAFEFEHYVKSEDAPQPELVKALTDFFKLNLSALPSAGG